MIPAIVIAIVIGDFIFAFFLIRFAVGGSWKPIERDHPPQPPHDGALAERHQSFKLGLLNLGWSVHVAVDEEHLHLTPAKWIGWIGIGPVSIPWSAMTMKKRGARWSQVMVGKTVVHGPSWCFELVE